MPDGPAPEAESGGALGSAIERLLGLSVPGRAHLLQALERIALNSQFPLQNLCFSGEIER